ncbi:MAG: hypothetical protein CVT68_05850 [Actinobacteria bacterium HGW-Actinobacteria-8]|nr:MAG: hypothetical protein CVT68_05850 [Actinobacteria bacterium HGW-Actinobacteria-8]
MSTPARMGTIVGLVGAVTALVASVAWTANEAAFGQPVHGWLGIHQTEVGQYEATSGLEGSLVDVIAMDMGGHGMMNRPGAWLGDTMLLRTHRVEAPAGTVTLRLYNGGALRHEIVILPLRDGQRVGQRSVGRDGTVDESESLGEASRSGGAGPGDGVEPGTTGWVTLELTVGRYEIACNIENHYAAGMYTLLVVR